MSSRYTIALEEQRKWIARSKAECNSLGQGWSAQQRQLLTVVAELLEVASPVYVAAAVCEVLEDAMPTLTDREINREDFPCECGFAFLDGAQPPLILSPLDGEIERRLSAVAWLTSPNDQIWHLVEFSEATRRDGHKDTDFAVMSLRLGEPIDAFVRGYEGLDYARKRAVQVGRWSTALWAFMRQRISVTRDEPVDRAWRRRLERDGKTDVTAISVVELRRRAYEVHPDDGYTLETTAPNWSCRWISRAHWRLQPYPARGTVERILIPASIKGPPEKPLKTASKLFAVVR